MREEEEEDGREAEEDINEQPSKYVTGTVDAFA